MPPMHEIAHLAHVELRTQVPDESLEFFTGYLGLTETRPPGSAGPTCARPARRRWSGG